MFDIERIDIEVLLYQAGYLTIKEAIQNRRRTVYKLGFPNYEVKSSFSEVILDYFLDIDDTRKIEIQDTTYDALIEGDVEKFINSLKQVFTSIPHTYWTYIKSYEGFYASIVYAYLQALGIDIIGEDITNKGRIDLTLFIENKIYVIEFKVIKSEGEKNIALKQIKEKRYYEKYTSQQKEIYLIGIEFSEEEKNIVNFEWERI